jgi:hypothetical protein
MCGTLDDGTKTNWCLLSRKNEPFFYRTRAYRDPTVPVTQYNGLCHVTEDQPESPGIRISVAQFGGLQSSKCCNNLAVPTNGETQRESFGRKVETKHRA